MTCVPPFPIHTDGQRAVKYYRKGETLYFDAMWSVTAHGGDLRQSKHIYVGQTRIATRQNREPQGEPDYELKNTYWYHPDHLGSAQLVTDPEGRQYERIEYTPYGELWIEATADGMDMIPFRFTGKELDAACARAHTTILPIGKRREAAYAETGLYYYGARYLDPKTTMWLSSDPALGEYIPSAPVNDEARKRNGNLPGMGGVYNTVNFHLYHYAGNNPVKFTDPDGKTYNLGTYQPAIDSFTTAINYLKNGSDTAMKVIEYLDQHQKDIQVVAFTLVPDNTWNPIYGITWNPQLGAIYEGSEEIVTPAMALMHELAHEYLYLTGQLSAAIKEQLGENYTREEYEALAEKMVLDLIETPVAMDLGEPTRTKYGTAEYIPVESPTSTKVLQLLD